MYTMTPAANPQSMMVGGGAMAYQGIQQGNLLMTAVGAVMIAVGVCVFGYLRRRNIRDALAAGLR